MDSAEERFLAEDTSSRLQCPACGAPHAARQKYCGECGRSLAPAADARVASLQPDSGFLAHGEPHVPPRDPIEGPQNERKHITVLFADIKGSLELLADRDPEDANRLLDNTLHRMMDAVHQYKGTVSQARGDGIMAIFGAPRALEDHAVRACYAALRIQQSVAAYSEEVMRSDGVAVRVRIGINSGEAVLRSIRNDLYVEYTAVGPTTHLAARMEQVAAPGGILVTAATRRLCDERIVLRPMGPLLVRGWAAPIDTFEVAGAADVQPRRDALGRSAATPFVGREREMAELLALAAEAASGASRTVLIVGEAGIGKSRLLGEFVRSARLRDALTLEARPWRFGEASSSTAVIEMLRAYFGIPYQAQPEAARERVTTRLMARTPGLADRLPALLALLDVLPPMHGFWQLDRLRRGELLVGAIADLVLEESRVQPVTVVFEDVEPEDSLTRAVVHSLTSRAADARILVLVCSRPEGRHHWASLPDARVLRLDAMGREAIGLLVRAMLGDDTSVLEARDFVCERAQGNPLFAEEMVRSLADSGAITGTRGGFVRTGPLDPKQLPDRVEAVLAARLDRLPRLHKSVLQHAAVIGSVVPLPVLQSIVELDAGPLSRVLADLQSAEFLIETRLYPEHEMAFKHALVHEVAYAELLRERRREIHARIVPVMAEVYRDRLEDISEQVAEHALRGELWDEAIRYSRSAGTRAADRYAYGKAVGLFERAISACTRRPDDAATLEQAIDLRFEMRNALQPLGDRDRIFRILLEAESLAERLGDPSRVGWVQSYLTDHYWIRGMTDEAVAAGEKALEIAGRSEDLALRVVTNLPLGLVFHTRGDYPRAIDCFGWNVEHLPGDLATRSFGLFVLPAAFSHSFLAWTLAETGEFDRALAHARRGVQLAEKTRHVMSEGYAELGLGLVHLRRGEADKAVAALRASLAVDAFASSPVGRAYVAYHLGFALAMSGMLHDGLAMLEETVALAEDKGFVARHALRLAHLAEVRAMAGRMAGAAESAQRAIALARNHGERANEAYALRAAGEVALYARERAIAAERLQESLAIAETLGLRPLAANLHRKLAQAFAPSEPTRTVRHARRAEEIATAIGVRFWAR